MDYDEWCMMRGAWCMIYDVWCMIYDAWYTMHDACTTASDNEGEYLQTRMSQLIRSNSPPDGSSTTPPASETIRAPAAMSQQWIPEEGLSLSRPCIEHEDLYPSPRSPPPEVVPLRFPMATKMGRPRVAVSESKCWSQIVHVWPPFFSLYGHWSLVDR